MVARAFQQTQMTLYLVHHGEMAGYMPSDFDAPLSADGRAQAAQLSDLFDTLGVRSIYTSPSIHALQTAAPYLALQKSRGNRVARAVAYNLYPMAMLPSQRPRWLDAGELAEHGFSVHMIDGVPPPPQDDDEFMRRVAEFFDNVVFERLRESPVVTALIVDGQVLAALAEHIDKGCTPELRELVANAGPGSVLEFSSNVFRLQFRRQIQ